MTHRILCSDGTWRGVADLAKARVVVVGDAGVDRWVYGHVSRISPEAPVPVFVSERTEESPGMAANVTAGIRVLGAGATLLTAGVASLKTRYVGRQMLLRVDDENPTPISQDAQAALLASLESIQADVLVISDYAKGVCTSELCQRLIAWARERGIKVIVDPKGPSWKKYDGCHVITPNEQEFATAMNGLGTYDIVVTRGGQGAWVWPCGASRIEIPARKVHAKDVCGAGDTFTATLACALAVGFSLETAARMANAAASVAVSKSGTSTVSPDELNAALCETP